MKVLLVKGNPRTGGFSDMLLEPFERGLEASGAQWSVADLRRQRLRDCLGCYHCLGAGQGECVLHDEMEPVLAAFIEADTVVCATPLYNYSMSADLKRFWERTLPVLGGGFELGPDGRWVNVMRYPAQWENKKLVTIIVGSAYDAEAYRPLNDTFRYLAQSYQFDLAAQITRRHSYYLQHRKSRPRGIAKVVAAFEQAGRETGERGAPTPETVAAAEACLIDGNAQFQDFSQVFWDHFRAMTPRGASLDEVQDTVAHDAPLLLRQMTYYFDPRAARGVQACVRFCFTDTGAAYDIVVSGGQCDFRVAGGEPADLEVRVDSAVWAQVATRQAKPVDALRDGAIVLEGDKRLFARLNAFFPIPD